MQSIKQVTPIGVQTKLDKPARTGPVTIQPQQLKQVSGGLPRGGWQVVVASPDAPRGGWL